jgi:isoamylase
VSWFDWDLEPWQHDLLATTRFLSGLRAGSPVLGQRSFFPGRQKHEDGVVDIQWFAADGLPMRYRTWDSPHTRTLVMFLNGTHVGGQSLLIIFHGGARDARVTMPALGDGATYLLVWDSVWTVPQPPGRFEPDETPATRKASLPKRSAQDAPVQDAPEQDASEQDASAGGGPVTVTAASVRVYGVVA